MKKIMYVLLLASSVYSLKPAFNNAGTLRMNTCNITADTFNNTGKVFCKEGTLKCQKFSGDGLIEITNGTLYIHAENFLFTGTIRCTENGKCIIETKTPEKNIHFKHEGNGKVTFKYIY